MTYLIKLQSKKKKMQKRLQKKKKRKEKKIYEKKLAKVLIIYQMKINLMQKKLLIQQILLLINKSREKQRIIELQVLLILQLLVKIKQNQIELILKHGLLSILVLIQELKKLLYGYKLQMYKVMLFQYMLKVPVRHIELYQNLG